MVCVFSCQTLLLLKHSRGLDIGQSGLVCFVFCGMDRICDFRIFALVGIVLLKLTVFINHSFSDTKMQYKPSIKKRKSAIALRCYEYISMLW